jgi:hypothetical protein
MLHYQMLTIKDEGGRWVFILRQKIEDLPYFRSDINSNAEQLNNPKPEQIEALIMRDYARTCRS